MLDVEKDHTNFSMKLGVEFESDDDAIEYYNSYAEATGFKIRKEYVNKNKVHGYVTSRKITCCKEGLQTTYNRGPWAKRPRRETRTGCLAHIIVTRQENGKYRVTQFEEAHNHPLSPPNQKRDNKERRIEELKREVEREDQIREVYRERLITFLNNVEEQMDFLSTKIQVVVSSVKKFETEVENLQYPIGRLKT